MVIQNNLSAFNANRMLKKTTSSRAKSSEKLSSGYKINRAADDAAGLTISEKMRRQIRGLTQASANCQDGVSLCQIADGALNEVQDMLKRCEELAIKAANDTNTEEDREAIQKELDQLSLEIDRVHTTTVFNDQNIFSENGLVTSSINSNNTASTISDISGNYIITTESGISITLALVDKNGNRVASPEETKATGNVNSDSIANSSLAQFAKKAAANAVSLISSKYPKLFANASTKNIQIGLQLNNIDGPNGTLASAGLKLISSDSNEVASYSMRIDTSDYDINEFDSYSDEKKADLAAVIAHEMTHLITYDTVSQNSYNTDSWDLNNQTLLPMSHWFIEGIAQTSSGHNGWLTINSSSSDEEIKNYMSTLMDSYGGSTLVGTYGAGYVATMYLGMLASGESMSNVNSSNIAKGLDNFMTSMAQDRDSHHSAMDNAIKKYTSFSNTIEFMDAFKNASGDSLTFVKNLISAIGNNGAGSILYDLNKPESSAFAPSGLTRSYDSYNINTDNAWYGNAFGENYTFPDNTTKGGDGFTIQAGAEPDQTIHINQYNISADALFNGQRLTVTGSYKSAGSHENGNNDTTVLNANTVIGNTIEVIKEADLRVSSIRSYYGAVQNRLEHTIKNLDNVVENTTAAESLIRDTDMATEMVKYANLNILSQAGQSMLAQANQSKQGILSLLQ